MVYNSGKIKFSLKMDNFQADIDLNAPENGILALTGKSGSGKSTLVRCINGLESHENGSINVIDVVLIVNFILDELELSDNQINVSDVNNDNRSDILDIVVLVNIILNR